MKSYYRLKYRVIHKSVKHFKNSLKTDYATDHGNSYAYGERNSPSFFHIFHRCSMCPPLAIRQTSMRQSISFHTHVSISRSIRATAAVIRWRRHRQPSSRNFAYHFLILLKTGAAFWNSVRNCRCTVTTDEVLAYSKTQMTAQVY